MRHFFDDPAPQRRPSHGEIQEPRHHLIGVPHPVFAQIAHLFQRRPPQSTTNPSELAVFRKSCNSNREHDVVNFVPETS